MVPGPRSDVLWLDDNLTMNWSTFDDLWAWPSADVAPSGVHANLGGSFRSPPAAVAIGDSLEVFGLGADYALWHKSYHLGVLPGRPRGKTSAAAD